MALAPTYAAHRLLPAAAGAHTLEVFLDYTCPFSAKIWRRLTKDVIPYLASAEPKVQPWHPASTLLHEASLAVEKINPSAFSLYSTALFEHQHEFFDEATVDMTRSDIVNAVDDTLAAGEPKNGGNAVTNDLKYHIKLARAQGIHVSPTVVFDGIRDDGVSSSWTLEQWKAWLAPRL
ncbi:hypothetical protein DL89DRAFT_277149 [Linderina pennispora]|uniref:Thioredoxin-like fold domain-containing protein n=1 Tax=Linderina pennispora TaxID=61395 RepID=A0A1Y1WL98_9FUNG|nr:uncharacterized protein DL89DRAFT_277149 [Linderina pennispora]ORX74339.1 hypothetical protein DL89DRAFT_277149 [Linderina pennispora]